MTSPVRALLIIRTLHSWHNTFEICYVCDRQGPCETWRQANAALEPEQADVPAE